MLVLSGGPNTSHCHSSLGQSLVIVWSCHEQPDQGEGQLFLYEQHQGRTETEKTKRGGVGQVRVEGHQSNKVMDPSSLERVTQLLPIR